MSIFTGAHSPKFNFNYAISMPEYKQRLCLPFQPESIFFHINFSSVFGCQPMAGSFELKFDKLHPQYWHWQKWAKKRSSRFIIHFILYGLDLRFHFFSPSSKNERAKGVCTLHSSKWVVTYLIQYYNKLLILFFSCNQKYCDLSRL